MPRCPSCDREIPAGAVRCEGCGARIIPEDLEARLRAYLAEGQKILAIAAYREATAASLVEAKRVVEALQLGGGLPVPDAGAKDLEPTLLAMLRGARRSGRSSSIATGPGRG